MNALIKCLVWDLDNTIWKGTLIEKDRCRLKPGIKPILQELDRRGILLSIASANDEDEAAEALKRKGLYHFFLYPQINWSKKVTSLQTIARNLNIGLDAIGFIDDEPFELEQVRQILPSVSTYQAEDYKAILSKPEMNPRFRTKESSQRRNMYLQESIRADAQKKEGKSLREFLKSCRTQLTVREAVQDDLPRILELLHRTHQLNATGKIYNEEEIISFLSRPQFKMYVVELKDRFVDYGKIGVAICTCHPEKWEVLCFLLSCRVMTRGIGIFFLSWLQRRSYRSGAAELHGHYVPRERNHRMQMLYTLSGFRPFYRGEDGSIVFAKKCTGRLHQPDWLTIYEEERR
jgi:FkbH-like protein